MSFKKIFLLFLWLWAVVDAQTVLVDKIVAVVNDDIITLSDVHRATELFPVFRKKNETEPVFQKRILQELIQYKVIAQEFQDEFQLNEEDYENVQTSVLEKAGSMENLMAILGRLGMTWKDLKAFIREKVLSEKVLEDRFQTKISIPFREIEQFYNQEYLPVQRQLGIQARSVIEMTPLIEKYLRRKKTDEKLREWLGEIKASYKIENLLERPDIPERFTPKPTERDK